MITPYVVTLRDQPSRRDDVIRIFFESARIQSFASEDARRAFQARWLDPYIDDLPELTMIAVTPDGWTAGYLTGCFSNAATARIRNHVIPGDSFARFYNDYPAHLHINVDAGARGAGVGAQLIEAFADKCRASGIRGVHLITSAGARNVRFYERNGFTALAVQPGPSGNMLMLGRTL